MAPHAPAAPHNSSVLKVNVVRGIKLINKLYFSKDRKLAREIADGKHNHDLECMLYYHRHNVHPITAIMTNDPQIQREMTALRNDLRLAADQRLQISDITLIQNLRLNPGLTKYAGDIINAPDSAGTVDELAERFKKSKSEIRRLKANGQLAALIRGEIQ